MDRVWQERAIRSWFSMWLEGKAGDLTALFTPDVQYIESWGPEYRGVSQVRHWFQAVSYTHLTLPTNREV